MRIEGVKKLKVENRRSERSWRLRIEGVKKLKVESRRIEEVEG